MNIVNVYSALWNPLDSYGRLSYELSNGLKRHGYRVNCFGPDAPQSKDISIATGGIFCSPAHLFPKLKNGMSDAGPKVGITMFEGTHLPDHWSASLNTMDRVVVPSEWLPDTFLDNGVIVPIDVVPLGINDVYKNATRRHKNKVFTIYATGDSGMRKGWHLVGQAFFKAFGESPHVKLIYKSRPGNMQWTFSNSNIDIIRGDLTDRAMVALYKNCNVMVFPSSGEGFGFPPREFAATGGMVASTNFGGTADLIRKWGDPLPYRMVRAWEGDSGYGNLGGRWAEADIDYIADWLTKVYENQDHYYDLGMEHAKFIETWYTWDRFISGVISTWEKAVKEHGYRNAKNTIQK